MLNFKNTIIITNKLLHNYSPKRMNEPRCILNYSSGERLPIDDYSWEITDSREAIFINQYEIVLCKT